MSATLLETGHWPGFVARVATPATPTGIADLIVSGWPVVIGGEVPGGCLLAILSQILLETGTRQVDRDRDGDVDEADQHPGFWNGNAGNIRGAYYGAWTSFRAGEGYGANETILEPGPTNRFRSYVLPGEDPTSPRTLRRAKQHGVRDLIDLLRRKYSRALEVAARRDYRGYVLALRDGGYFTANPETYYATEAKLARTVEMLPQVAAYLRDVAV